jgi:ectoine hydroxylase-related dioxygenase (phytanoyl-CoA dioxygenase family)
MQVIPGTHSGGFSDYVDADSTHNTFDQQIKHVDTSNSVYFELEPGECSLHDGRIIHGADANTSPFRRTGYTMRYFPTSVLVYPERNRGHRLWLARGKDLAGNTYEVM